MSVKPAFFSRKFKAFSVDGCLRRGVHPTIRRLFFPLYSYDTAKSGPFTNARERGMKKETRLKSGLFAGLLVDTEMKRSVTLLTKYNLPTEAFVSHKNQMLYAEKFKYQMEAKDCKSLKKKLSVGVNRIFQSLLTVNLKPVSTQTIVGCSILKVATAVDLVCKDLQGRVVIVEIKTGFMHYYRRFRGYMNVLTPSVTDCPYHQHQLQLLLTYQLYRSTFPSHKMGNAFVIRVDAIGVDILPLCDVVKNNASRIFSAVESSK